MASPSSPSPSKPRSMFAGSRNILRSNDSASLWNCTLSPGWTEEQSETLRLAVMKYGIGNWAKIIDSGYLPGKTNAQMNLQLQRLLGQQSTAEFAGLHIDPKVIGEQNSRIQGPEIRRKNNTIVNTGDKMSREQLRERILKNKEMYELPEETWKNIELDYMVDEEAMLEEKKKQLKLMRLQLKFVKKQLQNLEFMHPLRVTKLKTELGRLTGVSASPSTSETSAKRSSSSAASSSSPLPPPQSSTSEKERMIEDDDEEIDELAGENDEETPESSMKETPATDAMMSDTDEWMSATDDVISAAEDTMPAAEGVPSTKRMRK